MTADPPVPNQLGNYDVLSKIAEGGMGTVFKGRHRGTGETVAIKVIAPATAKNPVLLKRFKLEFEAAQKLNHPNVVRALDFSDQMPHPYLVMQFVDGQSIGQRIEKHGPYTEAEAVRLVAQVCEGLQSAHKQGLVHRDVKPDNILVTRDGVARLTDLGLVKEVEGDLNLTRTGRGLGTPHYMAPEQFRNAKTVDVRGDIYSLGATLYAMVTGVIPFDNASPLDCWMKKIRNEFRKPRELNPSVSERLDWAICRAMSAEPGQRPSSCREFVEDITGQSRSAPTGPAPALPAAAPADVWYLVYRDENDRPHTVKGSTDGIRNALRDNLLGDPSGVLVSRTKHGQFTPLSSVPEFRDLVVTPAALPVPGARNPTPDETVDYQAHNPGGPGASAARRAAVPVPGPKTGTVKSVLPPSGVPSGSHRAPPPPRPEEPDFDDAPPKARKSPRRRATDGGDKPFNWTPVLAATVLVLAAVIGYLVFAK